MDKDNSNNTAVPVGDIKKAQRLLEKHFGVSIDDHHEWPTNKIYYAKLEGKWVVFRASGQPCWDYKWAAIVLARYVDESQVFECFPEAQKL